MHYRKQIQRNNEAGMKGLSSCRASPLQAAWPLRKPRRSIVHVIGHSIDYVHDGVNDHGRVTLLSRTGCLHCPHVTHLLPKRHLAVALSEAKSLLGRWEIIRYAQNDRLSWAFIRAT